jgi:hypothetical protein
LNRQSSSTLTVAEGSRSTMSNHPLSEDYLRWLGSQIRGEDDGHPDRTYDGLLAIMYEKEFVWLIPNDDNRVGDGLALRVDFCRKHGISTDCLDDLGSCSFLEVLIGLSRRLSFAAGGTARGWAWELMNNLVLHRITDPVGRGKARRAHDILDTCIWRSYSHDGVGGFFPLKRPNEDQCKVEIWYQMAAYLYENDTMRPEG